MFDIDFDRLFPLHLCINVAFSLDLDIECHYTSLMNAGFGLAYLLIHLFQVLHMKIVSN